MKMKSVFIPVPVEEHKPATNPATNVRGLCVRAGFKKRNFNLSTND